MKSITYLMVLSILLFMVFYYFAHDDFDSTKKINPINQVSFQTAESQVSHKEKTAIPSVKKPSIFNKQDKDSTIK